MAPINFRESVFRWLSSFFLFLLGVQILFFFLMRESFREARQRLEDNRAKVGFSCGDFNGDQSYWPVHSDFAIQCQGRNCPGSYWQKKNQGSKSLHVLSVKKPRPNYYDQKKIKKGYFVNVKVKPSPKPMILVLINQSLLQWNLEVNPESLLEEVIVIGSEVAWIQGLPKKVPLTFFSKDQICVFPTAWEDIKNPDNQFRRLFMALKEYTDFGITSFQGRSMGWDMEVPLESPVDGKLVSQALLFLNSLKESLVDGRLVPSHSDPGSDLNQPGLKELLVVEKKSLSRSPGSLKFSSPSDFSIQWKRKKGRLVAQEIHFGEAETWFPENQRGRTEKNQTGQTSQNQRRKNTAKRKLTGENSFQKINIPEGTLKALSAKGEVFIIDKNRFGKWNRDTKQFLPLLPPLSFSDLHWPRAMAFNPLSGEIYIYNDERGGELFSYHTERQSWRLVLSGVGYSFMDLYFDKKKGRLYGIRFSRGKLREVAVMDGSGKLIETKTLELALEFSKSQWRVQILNRDGKFWLKRVQPAKPSGEIYSLFSNIK